MINMNEPVIKWLTEEQRTTLKEAMWKDYWTYQHTQAAGVEGDENV